MTTAMTSKSKAGVYDRVLDTSMDSAAVSLLDQMAIGQGDLSTKDGVYFMWEGLGCCCRHR